MAYKIMGVTAGRKNSNSEILLKEALMACEELGAEVRMINLKDFHIEPCTGCTSCTRGMAQGKNTDHGRAAESGRCHLLRSHV